ncbi:MAG: VOC family protein [Hyphomicrobiaceae bacterium]
MMLKRGAAGIMSVVMSTAVLPYQDPEKAADWLCGAFGFSVHHVANEPNGDIQYISLKLGRNFVLINPAGGPVFTDLLVEPESVGKRATQTCYVNVAEIEVHFAQAKLSGAQIALEPETDSDGSTFYMCRDLEGHLWIFGTRQYAAEPEEPLAAGPKKPVAKEEEKHETKEQEERKPVETLELNAVKPIELIAAEPETPQHSNRNRILVSLGALSLLIFGIALWTFTGGGYENTTSSVSVASGGKSQAPQQDKSLLDEERQRRKQAEQVLRQTAARLSSANSEMDRLRGEIQKNESLVLQSRSQNRTEEKIVRAQKLTEIILKQRLYEATEKVADLSSRNDQGSELQQTAQQRIAKAEAELANTSRELATVRQERDQLRQELGGARNDGVRPGPTPSEPQREPIGREETVEELVTQLKSRERAGANPDVSVPPGEDRQVAAFKYPPPRVLDTPCKRAAWTRVFAAQEGTLGWRLRNTMRLCWRAQFSTAPVKCVELVSSGGTGGAGRPARFPRLEIEDAVQLCGGTHNARKPIQCLVQRRASNQSLDFAINRCQEFGSIESQQRRFGSVRNLWARSG